MKNMNKTKQQIPIFEYPECLNSLPPKGKHHLRWTGTSKAGIRKARALSDFAERNNHGFAIGQLIGGRDLA